MNEALFLDRDGVINVEKDYLYKKEDFEFIEGIFELCKHYQDLGYMIFVVTNQSGIAREYYTEKDFQLLSDWMLQEFKKKNISIAKVYHCPHHPDIDLKCYCRKPEPGMILAAEKEFDLDLVNSLMVGDKEHDIEAAINAGVGQTYLFDETKKVIDSKATRKVNKLDEIWKEKC